MKSALMLTLILCLGFSQAFAQSETHYEYENSSLTFEQGSQKVLSFSLKNDKADNLLTVLKTKLPNHVTESEYAKMSTEGLYRLDFAIGDGFVSDAVMECDENKGHCRVYTLNKQGLGLTRGPNPDAIFNIRNDRIWKYKAYLSIENPTMVNVFADADILFNCESFPYRTGFEKICWLVLR